MREILTQRWPEAQPRARGMESGPGGTRRVRAFSAAIAVAAGALTVLGQIAGIDILARWIPWSPSMNPITAAMLMVGGAALLSPPRWQAFAMAASGVALIVAGGAKLAQIALGRPLGIDQLVAHAMQSQAGVLPSPVAPNTAAALVLLGVALALGRPRTRGRAILPQSLGATAIIIAVLALIGFALGSTTLNQITFNRMAVNTTVGLSALGLGLMSLTPQYGVSRLLAHDGPAGRLARLAVPICLIVPPLLGIGRLWAAQLLGFGIGDGVVIMIAGNILLSLALLWGCLIFLLRSDAERRAADLAIARSEEQYRIAERISGACHWEFVRAGRSLLWSPEFRSTLRLSADTRPGVAAMLTLIHPDDAPEFRALLRAALRSGDGWNRAVRLRHPDGSIQHVRAHGVCTRDERGRLSSIFGVIVDTTELVIARQAAESATHAQASFLANMSHEIRTPLNGVIGFLDLLLDSQLDQTQRRYVSLVSESAQSLLKLLNDILDLSKVEAGELAIVAQPTDLRRAIRHAVRLMAPLAEQKSVALEVRIAPDFPAGLLIDGARFRQILLNLLGNALKFTERGSVVVGLARTTRPDGTEFIEATIADSGVGIPEDRQQMVFQPFVQADDSTSRRFGGSGLGLSISRQLAERMGGTIALDSKVGVGTTVTLTLPLVEVRAVTADRHLSPAGLISDGGDGIADVSQQASTSTCLSVLLVEDMEINRQLVAAMLERLGHRVDFARNGAEAVELAGRLREHPSEWDLILMDIQMPVLNGWDATARIRAMGGPAATIPIVALSANAYPAEIEQSRAAGMDDHAVKPVGFKELHRLIERWGRSPRTVPSRPDLPRAANA